MTFKKKISLLVVIIIFILLIIAFIFIRPSLQATNLTGSYNLYNNNSQSSLTIDNNEYTFYENGELSESGNIKKIANDHYELTDEKNASSDKTILIEKKKYILEIDGQSIELEKISDVPTYVK